MSACMHACMHTCIGVLTRIQSAHRKHYSMQARTISLSLFTVHTSCVHTHTHTLAALHQAEEHSCAARCLRGTRDGLLPSGRLHQQQPPAHEAQEGRPGEVLLPDAETACGRRSLARRSCGRRRPSGLGDPRPRLRPTHARGCARRSTTEGRTTS